MAAKPPSVRRVIILALTLTVASTVLVASGLCGYQVYRTVEQADLQCVQNFTQAAAVLVADAAYASVDRQAHVWGELTNQEPDLLAIQLVDHTGEVQFSRGHRDIFTHPAAQLWSGRASFVCRQIKMPETPEPVTVAILPIRRTMGAFPGGALLVALRHKSDTATAWDRSWQVYVMLILTGVTGALLGAVLLGRYLLRPLKLLSEQVTRAALSGEIARLPVDRDDELGRLARAFQQIQGGLEEWRQRAGRIEKRFDQRVVDETKRISAELRSAEKRAWTDPLTGLGNRLLLDQKFGEIFESRQASGQDMAVVMMDVDNFKDLNDTLGHAAGDDLLRFIGELLRQCLRGHDLAIRIGGDEFVLLLPGASATAAASVAERTIRLFGQRAQLLPMSPKPSMSAGVASIHADGVRQADALLEHADSALYHAKHHGKAQVVVYGSAREPVLAG